MATRSSEEAKLIVKIEYGTSTRNRSFSDVNPELSDNNFLSIGTKIGALQSHTVSAIIRQDTCILTA